MDKSDLVKQYERLTDEELAQINVNDLIAEARPVYETELQRRSTPEYLEQQRIEESKRERETESRERESRIVAVTAGRQYAFPPNCVCCYEFVDGKSVLRISSQDRLGPMMFANRRFSVNVPYCPECKKHVAPIFRSGVGCLYALWFIVCVVGLGFMVDRQHGFLPQTSGKTWAISVLILGIGAPLVFWVAWERPHRYARARAMMKGNCTSLGPAVRFGLRGLMFENRSYADAFVRANPTSAKRVEEMKWS